MSLHCKKILTSAFLSRIKNVCLILTSGDFVHLSSQVERNNAVVLSVEDQHWTGDVIHTEETNTVQCCIQGHQSVLLCCVQCVHTQTHTHTLLYQRY